MRQQSEIAASFSLVNVCKVGLSVGFKKE